MNDKRMLLLTASGILVAILLVWAQLWYQSASIYEENGKSSITVGVSLSYVYYGIGSALISFTLILLKNKVGCWVKVFFSFAIIMALLQVGGSIFSAVTKTASGISILVPSDAFVTLYSNDITRNLLLLLLPIVIFIGLVLWFSLGKRCD